MDVTVEMIDAGARAIYAYEPWTWGDDSHVYETIADADRAQLRAIAAVAIEAALNAAEPNQSNPAWVAAAVKTALAAQEPDAEFEAALDAMLDCIAEHGLWEPTPLDGGLPDDWNAHVKAARARVLALHADARNAGLRELRAWIDTDVEAIPENKRGLFAVVAVAAMRRVQGQIDAMLGGDGE